MDTTTSDDYCYDLSPLDMEFLNMSPTEILNSTIQSTSISNVFGNSLATPENIPTKRQKTNLSYPVDILNQLKPCGPPRQAMFVSNSMGWDSRNTFWDTARSC